MPRDFRIRGFTLLELMAVFAVVGLILAVTAPRLLPMVAHFGHEGAARELASFGGSAIQHATLNNEEVIVCFNFETGTYWVEHWVPEDGHGEDPQDPMAAIQEGILELMNDPDATEEDLIEGARQLQGQFTGTLEERLRVQAELVEPNRSRDDQESAMRASWRDRKDRGRRMKREAFESELLGKHALPNEVYFDSVSLQEGRRAHDKVEVIISPLGLERDVRIKLVNADGEFYTVRWDPIVGRGFVYAGDWES